MVWWGWPMWRTAAAVSAAAPGELVTSREGYNQVGQWQSPSHSLRSLLWQFLGMVFSTFEPYFRDTCILLGGDACRFGVQIAGVFGN